MPGRRRWVSNMSGTRLPACRLGADGSKPDVDRQRLGQHLGNVLGRRLLDQAAPGKLFERAHVTVCNVACAPYLPRSAGKTRRGAR